MNLIRIADFSEAYIQQRVKKGGSNQQTLILFYVPSAIITMEKPLRMNARLSCTETMP